MDMNIFLQYIIIGIIVYSGLVAGKILAMITPEEIRPGKKNLILLQKIAFILIFGIFMFAIKNIIMKVIIAIIMLYFIYAIYDIKSRKLYNNNYYLLYTFIGLCLGFSPLNSTILYSSFSCFVIGMPTMSLNIDKTIGVYIKLFLVLMIPLIITLMIRF